MSSVVNKCGLATKEGQQHNSVAGFPTYPPFVKVNGNRVAVVILARPAQKADQQCSSIDTKGLPGMHGTTR